MCGTEVLSEPEWFVSYLQSAGFYATGWWVLPGVKARRTRKRIDCTSTSKTVTMWFDSDCSWGAFQSCYFFTFSLVRNFCFAPSSSHLVGALQVARLAPQFFTNRKVPAVGRSTRRRSTSCFRLRDMMGQYVLYGTLPTYLGCRLKSQSIITVDHHVGFGGSRLLQHCFLGVYYCFTKSWLREGGLYDYGKNVTTLRLDRPD